MRARARRYFLFALAASSALRAGAATMDAATLAYSPPRYAPGEELVASALLIPGAGEKLASIDLKPGLGLPRQSEEADPELRELQVTRTQAGWLLRERFVPWSPGPRALPSVRYKSLLIPELPYSASSALGPEDREPSPPRAQRAPPGTALYLLIFAAVLAVLALGTAVSALFLLPAARALALRRREGLAFKLLSKSLEYLEAEAESADSAVFFAALSRALRLYLSARVLAEAPSLTAAEIQGLPETAFPAPETKAESADLLALADLERYGGGLSGRRRDRAGLVSALGLARRIGEANEEALGARL